MGKLRGKVAVTTGAVSPFTSRNHPANSASSSQPIYESTASLASLLIEDGGYVIDGRVVTTRNLCHENDPIFTFAKLTGNVYTRGAVH
ncbi:hypothetical protein NKJ73_22105 [Mesorhizobium sp. M0074]|uniref:hypothetical protein n=1 Tax=unclassified Mesorhizobium TaxID=325217 RepID=UPI003337DCEE